MNYLNNKDLLRKTLRFVGRSLATAAFFSAAACSRLQGVGGALGLNGDIDPNKLSANEEELVEINDEESNGGENRLTDEDQLLRRRLKSKKKKDERKIKRYYKRLKAKSLRSLNVVDSDVYFHVDDKNKLSNTWAFGFNGLSNKWTGKKNIRESTPGVISMGYDGYKKMCVYQYKDGTFKLSGVRFIGEVNDRPTLQLYGHVNVNATSSSVGLPISFFVDGRKCTNILDNDLRLITSVNDLNGTVINHVSTGQSGSPFPYANTPPKYYGLVNVNNVGGMVNIPKSGGVATGFVLMNGEAVQRNHSSLNYLAYDANGHQTYCIGGNDKIFMGGMRGIPNIFCGIGSMPENGDSLYTNDFYAVNTTSLNYFTNLKSLGNIHDAFDYTSTFAIESSDKTEFDRCAYMSFYPAGYDVTGNPLVNNLQFSLGSKTSDVKCGTSTGFSNNNNKIGNKNGVLVAVRDGNVVIGYMNNSFSKVDEYALKAGKVTITDMPLAFPARKLAEKNGISVRDDFGPNAVVACGPWINKKSRVGIVCATFRPGDNKNHKFKLNKDSDVKFMDDALVFNETNKTSLVFTGNMLGDSSMNTKKSGLEEIEDGDKHCSVIGNYWKFKPWTEECAGVRTLELVTVLGIFCVGGMLCYGPYSVFASKGKAEKKHFVPEDSLNDTELSANLKGEE